MLKQLPANHLLLSKQVILFLLLLATLIAYLPIFSCSFINYDDPAYVYENPHIISGLTIDGIRWALTATKMSNWHPMTWLSYMLDSQLYGINPKGFHATNLLLHIVNTLLLFLTVEKLTEKSLHSGFVAALFALHPLHVESVVWISERKDILSAMFFILSLLAYSCYVKKKDHKAYILALISYTAGLMSKPMIVTLPVLLLLLDWHPLKRFRNESLHKLLLEKLPFFILAAAVSVLTIYLQQQSGALAPLDIHPLTSRITTALYANSQYLLKTFMPIKLAFFYPMPKNIPTWQTVLTAVLLILITIASIFQLNRRPYLAFGLGWFLIALLPVIGVFQVGIQSHADRYTYLPHIGLFTTITWGITELNAAKNSRMLTLGATFIILLFTTLTFRQSLLWKDSTTLYKHTLAVTKNNFTVHYNLGVELDRLGRFEEATGQFREAVRIEPKFVQGEYSLGITLAKTGRIDEAIANFIKVIQNDSENEDAYRQLAYYLAQSGKKAEAIYYYSKLLQLDPGDYESRYRLKTLKNGD